MTTVKEMIEQTLEVEDELLAKDVLKQKDIDFLHNIKNKHESLSSKQMAWLEDIWAKVCKSDI